MRRSWWLALAWISCSACGSTAASEPATPPVVPVAASATALPCMPLVSGCGCSYACARAVHRNDDGSYDVTWWGQDSRTDRATLGRLCLPDGRCRDAFQDATGCGGECIPTDAHFGCHLDAEDSCVP